MQKLIGQLKAWWTGRDKRQLQNLFKTVVAKDIGYARTDVLLSAPDREEQVFQFLNSQIAKSRRPYRFSLYLVSLSWTLPGDNQKPSSEDFLPSFNWNDYWHGAVREQIRQRVSGCGNAVDQVLRVAITSGGDLLKALADEGKI